MCPTRGITFAAESRKGMKTPQEEHISRKEYDAVCQERDQWAALAMAQHQRLLQFEQLVHDLKTQLGEQTNRPILFCRITREAYEQHKEQNVEDELRSACTGAPKLIRVIRTNEALGYLDTANLSAKELYDLLNEHFGLSFGLRTFQLARSQ